MHLKGRKQRGSTCLGNGVGRSKRKAPVRRGRVEAFKMNDRALVTAEDSGEESSASGGLANPVASEPALINSQMQMSCRFPVASWVSA